MQETADKELVVLHDLHSVLAASAPYQINQGIMQELAGAGLQLEAPATSSTVSNAGSASLHRFNAEFCTKSQRIDRMVSDCDLYKMKYFWVENHILHTEPCSGYLSRPACQAQHVKQAFALSLCWETIVVQYVRRQVWQAWLHASRQQEQVQQVHVQHVAPQLVSNLVAIMPYMTRQS